MMRPEEIEGLTPQQIKNKFALPELPSYISEVHLPRGSYLQLGTTASQEGWGIGGAIQYQALDRLPRQYFQNPLPIEQYQNQIKWSFKP
jgi:filamentous hemagglutinin